MLDEENPMKILKKRYAKGEISRKEYLEMKEKLKEEEEEDTSHEEQPKYTKQTHNEPKKGSHLIRNIIILLILLAIAYFVYQPFAQAAAFKNVQISLADAFLGNVGLTSAQINFELNMYNPGNTTATLSGVTYSVYANSNYLGSGNINQQLSISPEATITVPTTFDVSYAGAGQSAWSALSSGHLTIEIKGTGSFNTVLGPFTVPFDTSKQIS